MNKPLMNNFQKIIYEIPLPKNSQGNIIDFYNQVFIG